MSLQVGDIYIHPENGYPVIVRGNFSRDKIHLAWVTYGDEVLTGVIMSTENLEDMQLYLDRTMYIYFGNIIPLLEHAERVIKEMSREQGLAT